MQLEGERPSYDELAALVVEQARIIAEIRVENEQLRGEVVRLEARVAELGRWLGRNSGNSSLLPPSDPFTRPEKKPFRPNLRTPEVYLPVFQHVPVERCAQLIADLTGENALCAKLLIRESTAAAEDHPDQTWPARVRWALSELNNQAKKAAEHGLTEIPPERVLVYLRSFHHGVVVGLSMHSRALGRKQSPARNLLERLRDRAGDVLRFAGAPALVPFTSNAGEPALQPVKTQVKIFGCHQSDTGVAA